MGIKDILHKVEKQFDMEDFSKHQYFVRHDDRIFPLISFPKRGDDVLRYPKILKLLKKIKQNQKLGLPKDFSLIDLGCGYAGILKAIKKEFPDSNLYGVDVFPYGHDDPNRDIKDVFKFYQLDFIKLLKSDFQCDIALMLNLYHAPGVFWVDGKNQSNDKKVKYFMEKLENGISSNFDYFVTMLNEEQYNSFKSGVSHYSKIPVKIIYEEPVSIGDGTISRWVVVKFNKNT